MSTQTMGPSGMMIYSQAIRGFYTPGLWEPQRGFRLGAAGRVVLSAELVVTIDDVDAFLGDPARTAQLDGTMTVALLGEDLPLSDGRFNLTRLRSIEGSRMTYQGTLKARNKTYCLDAYREIVYDHGTPAILDAAADMTTFFTVLREESQAGPIYGAGLMHFHLRDLPDLLRTIQTPGLRGRDRLALIRRLFRVAYGGIAEAFLAGMVPAEG